jgi:hypothetical protein
MPCCSCRSAAVLTIATSAAYFAQASRRLAESGMQCRSCRYPNARIKADRLIAHRPPTRLAPGTISNRRRRPAERASRPIKRPISRWPQTNSPPVLSSWCCIRRPPRAFVARHFSRRVKCRKWRHSYTQRRSLSTEGVRTPQNEKERPEGRPLPHRLSRATLRDDRRADKSSRACVPFANSSRINRSCRPSLGSIPFTPSAITVFLSSRAWSIVISG